MAKLVLVLRVENVDVNDTYPGEFASVIVNSYQVERQHVDGEHPWITDVLEASWED